MKPTIAVFLLLSVSLGAPFRASAQLFGKSLPEVRGVFNPVLGSGASYESVDQDGKKNQLEITIVEKDPSSGAYWMEYAIPESKGTMYMKSLISRQGNDAIVQHTIYQAPGEPPVDLTMTMSTQGMKSPKQQNQKIDFRAEAQNLGSETITTPAGSFSCQHWRTTKEGTDVWISEKVTPWGLVKMSGPDVGTITLARVITGAKTHITGTPISLEEMMRKQRK